MCNNYVLILPFNDLLLVRLFHLFDQHYWYQLSLLKVSRSFVVAILGIWVDLVVTCLRIAQQCDRRIANRKRVVARSWVLCLETLALFLDPC